MAQRTSHMKALNPAWLFVGAVALAVCLSTIVTTLYSQAVYGHVVPGILFTTLVITVVLSGVLSLIFIKILAYYRIREDRFSYAVRSTNDGLWDWDLASDEFYLSPRWKAMLGYEEDEIDNHIETWRSLIHPDDKDSVLSAIAAYIEKQTDSYEAEMRLLHKDGTAISIRSRGFRVMHPSDDRVMRLVGTDVDVTAQKHAEQLNSATMAILRMIAIGQPAAEIYDAIARMYEARHPGMRCSMLELRGNKLLHGGAPSLPKDYCDAVHGLVNGPDVGSCGTSTYTGERCLVEDIANDPKWADLKEVALSHGLRSCWSEPIKNSSGQVLGAFGMYHDHPAMPGDEQLADLASAAQLAGIVMERDQTQQRIQMLAYTDELTGLASRAHFYQTLEDLIQISDRHDHRFGLLYIDMDDFKNVNDSLGHDVGDMLLQELADRLESIGRDVDFVARLGGDEFCILVTALADDYVSADIAQRCLKVLSEPLELLARKLSPSCSIGIAHFPEDGTTPSDLIKAADTALYAAKENGKGCYAFYKPDLTRKAEYRFQFEQALRLAIEKEQLSLLYQPKVDIETGTIVGVEALTRWQHPSIGPVPAVEFIDAAERIGMIKPLTEWVLTSACHQLMAWKKQGLPSLRMAVNISPSHFLDREIVSLVKRVLQQTGIQPDELELEVTEGVVQTDSQNLTVFKELKNYGVLLSIDDFGTGYSSLSSLKHLKVDFLKIDKLFIDDMLTDNEALILVRSMIEMGQCLGYGIIAEGVETAHQLEMIRQLGCTTAQGLLFSKPVSPQEIETLLRDTSAAHEMISVLAQ